MANIKPPKPGSFRAAASDRAKEENFLYAWEHRLVPFSMNAESIIRVRQILRANGQRGGVQSEGVRAARETGASRSP